MRVQSRSVLLLSLSLASLVGAADETTRTGGAPSFVLPEVGEKATSSRYTPAQAAFVQTWLRQLAPECPVELTAAVAEQFLDELRQRHPHDLDRLLAADFPTRKHAPMLLRHAAARLTGLTLASQREQLAERRVAAVLSAEGAAPADAADLILKLRDLSAVQHRRLLEGRLEDDELILLLSKARRPTVEATATAPTKVRELTAGEIVAEFGRRNQSGNAVERLQAYTVEATLTDASGATQDLLLFKMRPDRFRMVLRQGGFTRYIMAADGDRFWQQLPGQSPQIASARNVGERRYLQEFSDPLFVREGFVFERLPDGEEEGQVFHRIAVRRPDGTSYVARIDVKDFHQVGRENPDKSVARYSDFREVAGVTLAFREEVTDATGGKGRLIISRITPNPGLVASFFQPRPLQTPDLFAAEKSWIKPTVPNSRLLP